MTPLRRSASLRPAALGLAIVSVFVACAPGEAPLPPPPAGRASFEALLASDLLTGFAVARSGEAVLYSLGGVAGDRLIERSLSGGGERLLPLPAAPWPWRIRSVSPRGRDLLLVGGFPGEGCRAPLAVRRGDGSLARLDPPAGGCTSFLGWLHGGERVLLALADEVTGAAHAVEAAPESGQRWTRLERDPGWRLGPLSPDGRLLAVSLPGPEPPPELALLDLESGEVLPASLPGRVDRLAPQAFAASGRELFALWQSAGEMAIARLDLDRGKWSGVPRPCPRPERLTPSPGGRFLGVDCASPPHRLLAVAPGEAAGWLPVSLPLPAGVEAWGVALGPDDQVALIAAGSALWPPDLFAWEPGAAATRQLTYHLGPRVDPEDLGPARPVPAGPGWRAALFTGRPETAPVRGVVWVEDPEPGDGRPAPPFHPLAHWLANQGLPVLRLTASASPFGDPPAPPDLDLAARDLATAPGGAAPSGLVGVGRLAARHVLTAPGPWRVVLSVAPGPLPAPGDPSGRTSARAEARGSPEAAGSAPSAEHRVVLALAGELPASLPAGAAALPVGAIAPCGPASREEMAVWRTAARTLRDGARR